MRAVIIFAISAISFFGCDVFDKPELIPSFIEVDHFTLTAKNDEGTTNNKIKDCWVYADYNLVGVYELPARIPIFMNGETQIDIYPGIYKNGVQEERVIYPFYTYYSSKLNLQPDSTIVINPAISYLENSVIWVEDFEDPGFKLNQFASSSDTTMIRVTNPNTYALLEGGAGLIKMSASNIKCEMRTDEPLFYNLSRDLYTPAYFEMNYKSNYKFYFGLLDNNSGLSTYNSTTLITFNPTTDENGVPQWNKTYLYIPDVTNFYQQATKFDFFITVYNIDETSGIEVYVDNLKVVYDKL